MVHMNVDEVLQREYRELVDARLLVNLMNRKLVELGQLRKLEEEN